MNSEQLRKFIETQFDKNAIPSLEEYIRIPNLSRNYDSEWATNGLLEKAAHHIKDWVLAQNVKGLNLQFLQEKGRTPTLYVNIEGQLNKNILMYGHFDKQPHMVGWLEHLGPVKPVIEDGKLYGRGGADDGYAIYTAILAIKAIQEQGLQHGRIQMLLEGDEESGSEDLPYFLNLLKKDIGNPELIICLDSGASDYERLWVTSSLRGVVIGYLKVEVLTEGVHSGDASGIVPDSFRLLRALLDRIENSVTGEILRDLHVEIPHDRYQQCFETSKLLGDKVFSKYPFVGNTHSYITSHVEAYLNRCWRPALSVVGQDGLPHQSSAGNVCRAQTTMKLSLRIPPTMSGEKAAQIVKQVLEKDPPQGCKVSFSCDGWGEGWNAPSSTQFMTDLFQEVSQKYYQKQACYCGEGGSIPFMKMLGDYYPQAQFAILGVLGPNSNAHGPNEFLHIQMCKNLTMCVSEIVYRVSNN